MIILLVIFGVIITFIFVQLFAYNSQRNIEVYPYLVTKKFENFEIRNYQPSLFTSVKLSTKGYKNTSSKGFSILAGYIFGNNERNQKIAMTSPVAMKLDDSVTMMFMVPRKLKKEMLPKPDRSEIEFKEEPTKTVAAINFEGWANDEKIERFKEKLKLSLDAEGILYSNQFYFLGYNAPYEIFNRKNEIIVELKY